MTPTPPFWSVPNAKRNDENHSPCTCDYERLQLHGVGAKFRLASGTGSLDALHGGDGHAGLSADRQEPYPERAPAKCTTATAQAAKRHEQHAGHAALHQR